MNSENISSDEETMLFTPESSIVTNTNNENKNDQRIDDQATLSVQRQSPNSSQSVKQASGFNSEVSETNPELTNVESEATLNSLANSTSADESSSLKEGEENYATLIFRDGLDLPISALELYVTLPSGETSIAKTTTQGAITLPLPAQAGGHAQIEVKDFTGQRKKICSIDLKKCTEVVIIRSPKVAADIPLRQHQQTPPSVANAPTNDKVASTKPAAAKKTATTETTATQTTTAAPTTQTKATQSARLDINLSWWNANGAMEDAWKWLTQKLHLKEQIPWSLPKSPVVAKTLSNAGQPVTVVVGPECPNKDKLRLGRNNVYREAILGASKRLGLIPQALCALMDCEAGKVTEHIPKLGPDGKQLKDKKGKPLTTALRELWNANAGNPQSGAAGLTQFLASTWLSHVLRPGLYIHEQSVAKGWVRQETDSNGKSRWVFVLADNKTTTAPYSRRNSDDNVKKCLATRMDPTWSINAAADYGNANLQVLAKHGFKLSDLNDMDKAKLMYLLHHEGEGAGPLFIRNKLASAKGGIEGLRKKFATQLGGNGAAKAKDYIDDANGDVEFAYRKWLADYIDKQFSQSEKYFCSQPITPTTLTKLLPMIGGEKINVAI